MLVVTRLRVPDGDPTGPAAHALRADLDRARDVLAGCPGALWVEVARNVDEPGLWLLASRWEGAGAYRRAIGSTAGKMHVQPLMAHAVDEPSAYEVAHPGTTLNEARSRSLG